MAARSLAPLTRPNSRSRPPQAAATLHPYDAAYNPARARQLAQQQHSYYTGPPPSVAAAGHGGGAQTYAAPCAAPRAPQAHHAPKPTSVLDPRAFAPLGAAAAGLQRQASLPAQAQQHGHAGAATGGYGRHDPRQYMTIS